MIREFSPEDFYQVEEFIYNHASVSNKEKECVVNLIDEMALRRDNSIHEVLLKESGAELEGCCILTKRPCANGVFYMDLVILPSKGINGKNKEMLEEIEAHVSSCNGRWIFVETSSTSDQDIIRNIYLRNFYSIVSVIKDYYGTGNDMVLFGKYLVD